MTALQRIAPWIMLLLTVAAIPVGSLLMLPGLALLNDPYDDAMIQAIGLGLLILGGGTSIANAYVLVATRFFMRWNKQLSCRRRAIVFLAIGLGIAAAIVLANLVVYVLNRGQVPRLG